MTNPVVLSLCDRTGNWPRPYAEKYGWRVVTVDLQTPPAEYLYPGRTHIACDVRLLTLDALAAHGVLPGKTRVVLSAPPCTMFAASGSMWKRTPEQMAEALSIVDACVRLVAVLKPRWHALENPVGKLPRWLGPARTFFHPCDYGEPYTKRTGLWGEFVIPTRTPVEPTEGSKMHCVPDSRERANRRSATPMGFARAFADANQ